MWFPICYRKGKEPCIGTVTAKEAGLRQRVPTQAGRRSRGTAGRGHPTWRSFPLAQHPDSLSGRPGDHRATDQFGDFGWVLLKLQRAVSPLAHCAGPEPRSGPGCAGCCQRENQRGRRMARKGLRTWADQSELLLQLKPRRQLPGRKLFREAFKWEVVTQVRSGSGGKGVGGTAY